ncbi:MAG: hypothetical protein ACLPQ6_14180 [Steroidobacteraceae bacterium]|jgi:hypothetical protein
MHKTLAGLGILLLAVGAHADESPAPFDGVWTTVVSCPAAGGALPYSYEFASTVTNGVLHGERGIKGAPGWLALEGRILPDGSADLSARGVVARERAAIGQRPPGTPYRYRVDARFSGTSGAGHRVAGRSCEVSFNKKIAA